MSGPFDPLAQRLSQARIPFRRDVALAPLTCLGVGGWVPLFVEPRNPEEVARFQSEAMALGIRLECLGSGANLLVADGHLPFAVLQLPAASFGSVVIADGKVTAGAAASLEGLIRKTMDAGLAGLEGLVGIPASLGGALAMNAGGKHGEISDHLVSVTVAERGEVRRLSKEACGFSYRHSGLKGKVVLSAEFALSPGRPEDLKERAREIKEAKAAAQPLRDASAGCMFKNPPGDSAGRLIDAAGLKGAREGGAQVSDKHANFIVNLGGATADDIRRLITRVRDGVRRAHGVELALEVVTWP